MDLLIKKSKITSQDLEIGIGSVEQLRGQDTLQLTKLNAGELLGIICIDTLDELKNLNVIDLATKVVYITGNKAIYHYDGNDWVRANINVEIVESSTNLIDLPIDSKVAYSVNDGVMFYKLADNWVANKSTMSVVNKESDLYTLPTGINAAYVIENNMIYTYSLGAWSTSISTQNSSPILIVDSIDDLPKLSTITTCIVNDRNRGGIFTYDDTLPEVGGDNGIIIGKWRRIHLGLVNALWFGIDNQGNIDCSTLLTQVCKHSNVLVPPGNYLIKSPVEINTDITLQCIGATFILEEIGSIQFKGIKSVEASIPDIIAGSTSYTLNNPNLFKEGKYAYIKGTGSISEYSNIPPAQYTKMVGLTGATVSVSNIFDTNYVSPTLSILEGLTVKVTGLTIDSSSTVEALSIENVTDSTFSNVTIKSKSSNCISIKNSTGISLSACVLFTDSGSGSDAAILKDSSNIIFDSCIITAASAGIAYQGLVKITGLYKSVITAINPISSGDSSISLNVRDTQLTGTLKVGGINIFFDNCTIAAPFIEFYRLSGGSINITNCSFSGTSTNLSDVFIHVGSNKVLGDNYKLIMACEYNIVNNSFTGGQVYQGFIEIIGRQAKLNYPGTELASYVNIENLRTNLTQPPISAFGKFANINLKNITHKATKLIDIQSLYTANNRSIKTLATNIVSIDKFLIDDTLVESIQLKANVATDMTAPDLIIGITLPAGIFDYFYTPTTITKEDTGAKVTLKTTTLITTEIYKRMKGMVSIRYPQ